MNHYPESQYPNLYNEIVKDWNYRWGKFNPIPYPFMNKQQDDYKYKGTNKERNTPTLKQPPVWNPDLQRKFQK